MVLKSVVEASFLLYDMVPEAPCGAESLTRKLTDVRTSSLGSSSTPNLGYKILTTPAVLISTVSHTSPGTVPVTSSIEVGYVNSTLMALKFTDVVNLQVTEKEVPLLKTDVSQSI